MLRNPRNYVGEVLVQKNNRGYSLQLVSNNAKITEKFYTFKHNFLSNRHSDPKSLIENARAFAKDIKEQSKISNVSVTGEAKLARYVIEGLTQAGLNVAKKEVVAVDNFVITRSKSGRV